MTYFFKLDKSFTKKRMPPVLKTLTGIVYPKLIPGKGPAYRPLPRKKHDGDKSFYTEPQVMVNEHDLGKT